MGSDDEKLTKLYLQAFGLSDYTIKQLVKGLEAVSTNGSLNEYVASNVKAAVEQRLANSRIKAENRAKLQRVLTWLNDDSNVIQVDFLKGSSPEKRIEVLRSRIQELEAQEQTLTQDTKKLITQARKMVASK